MEALGRDAIASGMAIATYERHDTTVNASEAAVVPEVAAPV
jgi:hypothetical protein